MKNTIKLFGIIAFIAVIGFSAIACGEGEDDLSGTWIATEDGETMKLVLTKTSFTMSIGTMDMQRGTYTTKDNSTFTMVPTAYHSAFLNLMLDDFEVTLSAGWHTQPQISAAILAALTEEYGATMAAQLMTTTVTPMLTAMFEPETGPYKLSGKTLTFTSPAGTTVFTKQ